MIVSASPYLVCVCIIWVVVRITSLAMACNFNILYAFHFCSRQEKACYGIKVACVMPGGFKTKMMDSEIGRRRLETQWEALPTDVKEEFGDQYLDKSKCIILSL